MDRKQRDEISMGFLKSRGDRGMSYMSKQGTDAQDRKPEECLLSPVTGILKVIKDTREWTVPLHSYLKALTPYLSTWLCLKPRPANKQLGRVEMWASGWDVHPGVLPETDSGMYLPWGVTMHSVNKITRQQEGNYLYTSEEKELKGDTLLAPWSYTFNLPSFEETKVCCVSNPACDYLVVWALND